MLNRHDIHWDISHGRSYVTVTGSVLVPVTREFCRSGLYTLSCKRSAYVGYNIDDLKILVVAALMDEYKKWGIDRFYEVEVDQEYDRYDQDE